MRDRLIDLMMIPGLSGHEQRVARYIAGELQRLRLEWRCDRLGNLVTSFPGDPDQPSVMLFTHMDQLGFIVRKVEADGRLRLERLGGVPERALAAQAVIICGREGDVPGVIGNKSHHATQPAEKYSVVPYADLSVDAGFSTADEVRAAGIEIGAPVVYAPRVLELAKDRIAGTSVDDRAGCSVMLELAERWTDRSAIGPTVHLVWSVQEEFNLRGVLPMAHSLAPDIAVQIDLMLTSDTPETADRGEMVLGGGPGMSLYSFHGRGTLNGIIPHPRLVAWMEAAAAEAGLPLQRSAQTGVLTDLSYVQFQGDLGVACIDVGYPMRYSHSALEVVDLRDLEALTTLLQQALKSVPAGRDLVRLHPEDL